MPLPYDSWHRLQQTPATLEEVGIENEWTAGWMDGLKLFLTLPGMGLPAILALAISELVLRGTLRLAIPPSSSELERWPWL